MVLHNRGLRFNNSLNPTRPSLLTCGTLNYALSAMPGARIRARGLAQKGCVDEILPIARDETYAHQSDLNKGLL